MFLANLIYIVRSHPSAWHLETFQWHGWTRSPKNFIFLFEIYQFFLGKYFTFIYNPQALLESEKIVVCFADPRHKVLWEFSPNTTGHGLRVTKRPAVWHFSIFLFEKYQILLEIFYLYLESTSTSRQWKNSNVRRLCSQSTKRSKRDTSKKFSFGLFRTKFKIQ